MDPLPSLDDYNAADPARARLKPKKSFISLFKSLPNSKGKQRVDDTPQIDTGAVVDQNVPPESLSVIRLSNTLNTSSHDAEYKWVALYENQRGVTVFSIPYYSHLSLLPTDPYPFTIPAIPHSRRHQPNVNLDTYPLPNGNWRWVSKSWMIDMRSDAGDVQHDGFEYNLMFQSKHWKPMIGPFSFVRRRRWVRLMMRPGITCHHHERGVSDDGPNSPAIPATPHTSLWQDLFRYRHRASIVSFIPPSIITTTSDVMDELSADFDAVWQGDVEQDWARYKLLMKYLSTDGRKLDVWRRWLGLEHLKVLPPKKQWTEDNESVPSESPVGTIASQVLSPIMANIDYITPVVNKYGDAILCLFIFPESRARLIDLLTLANVLPDSGIGGISWASSLDFHSYTASLSDSK